jgi:hypothetical protein
MLRTAVSTQPSLQHTKSPQCTGGSLRGDPYQVMSALQGTPRAPLLDMIVRSTSLQLPVISELIIHFPTLSDPSR